MNKWLISVLVLFTANLVNAQIRSLDEFESTNGWSFNQADGVNVSMSTEPGVTGNAIRFDYDFTKGTGYGGIQKWFPVDLPENFEFTFNFRADSPANNFEIKFIDSKGNNVWWVNNRNYDFPEEWKKIRIRKRHISFAWGPTSDQSLKRIDRIEFTIASYVGGKGTIWLDDLTFEPLPPETSTYPVPEVNTTTALKGHPPENMIDNSGETVWQSTSSKEQHVIIDFRARREFGGLQINWKKDHFAEAYDVMLSMDGKDWVKAYSVNSNRSDVSYIRLQDAEAKYLKLILTKSHVEKWFGIAEIRFLSIHDGTTPNNFLINISKNSLVGDYPRYFNELATYWTVSGVNNDMKEAMINTDGMVEVDKGLFSIEPMIKTPDSFYNWSNVISVPSLGFGAGEEFTFLPGITWNFEGIEMDIRLVSAGEANSNSNLNIRYAFHNPGTMAKDFELYLLIRPLQVNPYYQWLNLTGGAGKINSIRELDGGLIAVDEKLVIPLRKYDAFSAFSFDQGNIVEPLRKGIFPRGNNAEDANGLAGGVMKYIFHLNPGEKSEFLVTVPFYAVPGSAPDIKQDEINAEIASTLEFWKTKTDHIQFNLPSSADRIINTYKANLVYVLINRDKAGIQPGSRSYERSWIRDGALTSSALLKSGIVPEVKDFINWYSAHLYENGKVPCVVDSRGPDPVPENDSHGEFIYLVREYFNFTHDTAFLRSQNENILNVVSYIESLIAERSTDHYKYGNDSVRAHYGLMPESISHEGYSAKPMHSYWDNFFTMKGLKDAAEIQKILGEEENYRHIAAVRDTFRENLYRSLQLAMRFKKIDYIPGCVELGDFDATSTTIALTPCNELNNLPRPQVYNTFDKYYEFFKKRRDKQLDWINYTPYENRLIGSFIILDQPDRAHELIGFFLDDQRPPGWNHWAEVVWKDPRKPAFIGDMPHTWCGSDFLNAIRSMFVYENEYDHSLVLASALYQDWIDAPEGMSVENLPTYYGDISYSIKKEKDHYRFDISGEVELPSNGMKIKNFNGLKMPKKVMVNGAEIKDFTSNEIQVKVFPAEVIIYY